MNFFSLIMIVLFHSLTLVLPCFAQHSKPAVTVPAADSKLVDLNLASREQLMTLPGIGENEAKKIVDGRPYQMKTELLKKDIIPTDTFYAIVNKVTIDLPAFAKVMREKEKKAFDVQQKTGGKKVKTRSGLVYQDLVVGKGAMPAPGKSVKVHYTGWLKDGTKFDSSVDRGEPFSFVIGKGEVIKGWDEGVKSMRVGGKRRLIIPPQLAYGKKGAGGVVPPNATLVFEVELIDVD